MNKEITVSLTTVILAIMACILIAKGQFRDATIVLSTSCIIFGLDRLKWNGGNKNDD